MRAQWIASAALAIGCISMMQGAARQDRGVPKSPPAALSPAPAPTPAPPSGTAPSARDDGTTGAAPSRGRRMAESLSAEEIDEVIAVASEISPEWGEGLRARRAKDPDGLRAAIASAGPRLIGLAMLKRSHPELFALRVEDLRIQNELKELARAYREKIQAADGSAAEIEAKLRQKVERQVDLDLRASAMELQALDEQVKRLVEQLKAETQQRGERIERVLEEIKAGGEPKPMMRPGSGGERGPRGARRPPPAGRDASGANGAPSSSPPAPSGAGAP